MLAAHRTEILALACGECPGQGFVDAAGLRITVSPAGENRLVVMEPVVLPAGALVVVMTRDTRLLRVQGALSRLVAVGERLMDVLDAADREDLVEVLADGGGGRGTAPSRNPPQADPTVR